MSPRSLRVLEVSEGAYRALLLLYPRAFRLEYGREMLQTFRASCRETLLREGRGALLRLWGLVCYDLLLTTTGEHLRAWSTHWKNWLGIEKEFIAMSSLLHLNVALLTDIGTKRPSNEDSVTSVEPRDQQVLEEKGTLFVVADGMGGHTKGELASKLAVEEVSKHYYASADSDIAAALAHAIKQANSAIYQRSQGAQNGMGTTCIAAVVQSEHVYIANVGDSRAYLVHEGQLRQVSEDHSVVAALLREGKISAEEALTHPDHNKLYRALGTKDDVEVDTFIEPVRVGDTLVLCTDGLVSLGLVSDAEICAIVEQYEPSESVSRLIALANERGAPDNVSVVVASIE